MSSRPVVFIADDDSDDRLLFQMAWQRSGVAYSIQIFNNGLDLLEFLKDLSGRFHEEDTVFPNLILLDMRMPFKNGLEVAEELQRDPRLSHIPLLLLTTALADRHNQQASALGIKQVLDKPRDMDGYVTLLTSLEIHFQT